MTTHSPNRSPHADLLWPAAAAFGVALALMVTALSVAAPPVGWLTGAKAAWYLSRASGIVAYFMMAGSVIWGLLLSTKLVKRQLPPAVSLAMHNTLSWSAIGLALFHAAILLFDSYYTYTIWHLLIPFTGPYAPIWVGLGTLAFWIALVTAASFGWRKRIGQKNWRRLHYLTFVAYIFVTLHGWMAGSDSLQLIGLYGGSALIVLFLTAYRLVDSRLSGGRRRRR